MKIELDLSLTNWNLQGDICKLNYINEFGPCKLDVIPFFFFFLKLKLIDNNDREDLIYASNFWWSTWDLLKNRSVDLACVKYNTI